MKIIFLSSRDYYISHQILIRLYLRESYEEWNLLPKKSLTKTLEVAAEAETNSEKTIGGSPKIISRVKTLNGHC